LLENDGNAAAFGEYRAVWFCFLNQGLVYAGTANSDSHGLTDNVLGTPRNVVIAQTTPDRFDTEVFDEAIRNGHLTGTNGPVIEASLKTGGEEYRPSVRPLSAGADAVLSIRVRAAPWVPVRQVRIVVNGEVAKTFDDLKLPAEPYGKTGLDRLDEKVPLSSLLPAGTADAWVIVEAGEPLPLSGDLDGNGIPDTGDNNGDGKVDSSDVASKDDKSGPLDRPPRPADATDPRYPFASVTSGGLPQAFTNPVIHYRDGNGFSGPGLKGGK
jgi:hypothetical protein